MVPATTRDLIDELAESLLLAEVSESSTLTKLSDQLGAIERTLPETGAEGLTREVRSARSLLDQLLGGGVPDPQAVLNQLLSATATMQRACAEEPEASSSGATPGEPGRLVLPPWVEDSALREFISGQTAALDEIEADALALEKGGAGRLASLKRRIHTLKGEAGVLGLEELEHVYHSLEDLLDSGLHLPQKVDRVLQTRDWIAAALRSYAALQQPATPVQAVLQLLGNLPAAPSPHPGPEAELASSGSTSSGSTEEMTSPVPAATPEQPAPDQAGASAALAEPSPSPAPSASLACEETESAPEGVSQTLGTVERDEETVALIGDFLQESAENLGRADQILMNIEHEGLTPEMVNGLFRVFHTIKGVSGFLELREVTSLAHITETLLNLVRQGTLELRGGSLDLVFDATAMMRRLLDGVRDAVAQSADYPVTPDLPPLLTALQAAISGGPVSAPELKPVEPGLKLGEILERTAAVPHDQIEAALVSQSESGRRLGEELVAQGVVDPKAVAQALRLQSQSDAQGAKIKETIKVDLDRVDSLVEMIGELVIVESMVVNLPEVASIRSHHARNYLGQLTKITRDLQSVGMRMRMVPVRGVFQKMARMVRDLSRKSGKQVRLIQSGEGTEMDRSMVEQIADPLVHMIRNAVDHGVEPPEARAAAGKPPMGVIRLSAQHEGGSIAIEIADDGRGLDREAILAKALSQGLIKEGQPLSDAEVWDLIFAPGFSTAKQVTEISGRGVGMDVVKRNIEAMRGRTIISTVPGKGTTFKIVLPLTLAIIDGMLVACGEERYILPTLSIIESIQPEGSALTSYAGKAEVINVRGEIIPLLRLDRLFGIDGAEQDPTRALVVVVESLGHKLGLLVDGVITQQQVVIKSLGTGMNGTRFVSGAAILSDGKVGLILNVEEIGGLKGGDWPFAAGRRGPEATWT